MSGQNSPKHLRHLEQITFNFAQSNVPRVHNISFVLDKVLDVIKVETEDEKYQLFDRLAAYYLQGRYPSFKDEISNLIDKEEAKRILEATKEVYQWMQTLKR